MWDKHVSTIKLLMVRNVVCDEPIWFVLGSATTQEMDFYWNF